MVGHDNHTVLPTFVDGSGAGHFRERDSKGLTPEPNKDVSLQVEIKEILKSFRFPYPEEFHVSQWPFRTWGI